MSQRRKQRSIFTKIDELACGLRQAKAEEQQQQQQPDGSEEDRRQAEEAPQPAAGSPASGADVAGVQPATSTAAGAGLQAYFECALAMALAQQHTPISSAASSVKPAASFGVSGAPASVFANPLFSPLVPAAAAGLQLQWLAAAAAAAAACRQPQTSGAMTVNPLMAAIAGAGVRPTDGAPVPAHSVAGGALPLTGAVAQQRRQQQQTLAPGAPRFQCADCSRSYSTFSGLSKHRQFHCGAQNKRAFSCKFCPKQYGSLGALKMHIRTHTLPCKCTVCGKAFSRPWLLQGHLRTHTGEKPFGCSACGRAFADRSNLRAHLQTHSDVKKYRCGSCGKTFSRMSLLTKHEGGNCSLGPPALSAVLR